MLVIINLALSKSSVQYFWFLLLLFTFHGCHATNEIGLLLRQCTCNMIIHTVGYLKDLCGLNCSQLSDATHLLMQLNTQV